LPDSDADQSAASLDLGTGDARASRAVPWRRPPVGHDPLVDDPPRPGPVVTSDIVPNDGALPPDAAAWLLVPA
jgi:hypothetical protein